MSRANYLTAKRVSQIEQRLHQRDRLIIADVAQLSVLSGAQIRLLHYGQSESDKRLARMDLARLHLAGVLQRLGRRVGGERAGSDGFVYSLGLAGQRIADPGRKRYRKPWTPQPNLLQHALAVSELYTQLRTTSVDTRLTGFDAEPTCWRFFSGPGGTTSVLKPDAYVTTETTDFEDSYFIEIDRATESGTRIASKAKVYVSYWQSGREQELTDVFPQVLWVVPDLSRRNQLVEVLSSRPAEQWELFTVTTFASAVSYLMGDGEAVGAVQGEAGNL